MVENQKTVSSKRARIACTINTVIVGASIIPSLGLVIFSPMMLCEPGASQNPWTWLLFIGIVSVPFLLLLSVTQSWLLFHKSRYRAAFWVAVVTSGLISVPAIPILSSMFFEFVRQQTHLDLLFR